jgi:hypothetical protein
VSTPRRDWLDPIRFAWLCCNPRTPFPAALASWHLGGAQER